MFKAPLSHVSCSKLGIWQLQLHYTRCGLEMAGLHISESRVIQVHGTGKKRIQKGALSAPKLSSTTIKVHLPALWTKQLPPLQSHLSQNK